MGSRTAATVTLDTGRDLASPWLMPRLRRAGLVAALAVTPLALAYRFAVVYRRRAGFPERRPPRWSPENFGLRYEPITVGLPRSELAGWFIPARDGSPGPGVVLVHGWESARDRLLPHVRFLNAAGFHCLLFDVRGHGANPPEVLPISGGEFGADAVAAFDALLARPEVTSSALFGHSMGAGGAILAAARDPRCQALVSVSAPADPGLLARQTFRLAHLPIPAPVAHPLAWLTARVYVRPRGHSVREISALRAIRSYDGPVLLVHGARDDVMPVSNVHRLARAALRARALRPGDAVSVATLVIENGEHSWLYEFPEFRERVAAFLASALDGPLSPTEAGAIARETICVRPDEPETTFAAIRRHAGPVLPGHLGRDAPVRGRATSDGSRIVEATGTSTTKPRPLEA